MPKVYAPRGAPRGETSKPVLISSLAGSQALAGDDDSGVCISSSSRSSSGSSEVRKGEGKGEVDPIRQQAANSKLGSNEDQDQIIQMLEEWAAWEKNLEDAAAQNDGARSVKDPANKTGSTYRENFQRSNAENEDVFRKVSPLNNINGKCKVLFSSETGSEREAAGSRGISRSTFTRSRSLGARGDPVAMARRHALKAWTAKRVRRCSSDVTTSVDRRRATLVDGELVAKGPKADRSRSSLSPTTSYQAFGGFEVQGRGSGRRRDSTSKQSSLSLSDKASSSRTSERSQRHDAHPWRANMKVPSCKLGLSPGSKSSEFIGAEVETAPSSPRSPVIAADMILARRPSPWVRSPSRETAGGLLIKRGFFYGSGGRGAQAAALEDGPDFEASWMRRFRQEIETNSEWWTGKVCRHPRGHQSTQTIDRNSQGRRGVNTPENRRTNRGVKDLWGEVGIRLALGKPGGDDGQYGQGERVESITESATVRSFQDRLRYTPLSQGAWLVDQALAEKIQSNGESQRPGSPPPHLPRTLSEVEGAKHEAPSRPKTDTRSHSNPIRGADEIQTQVVDGMLSGRNRSPSPLKRPQQSSSNPPEDTAQEEPRNLQDVYEAVLVKLRGQIDTSTRESIVLRAADDARGALARARERSLSPRSRRPHGLGGGLPRASVANRDKLIGVPETIDYDHVEATLSLIELAARAAGPDAGRQMLEALEGLEKINQQVRVEDGGENGGAEDGEVGAEDGGKSDTQGVKRETSTDYLVAAGRSEVSSDPAYGRTEARSLSKNPESQEEAASGVLSAISGWFWGGQSGDSEHSIGKIKPKGETEHGGMDTARAIDANVRTGAFLLDSSSGHATPEEYHMARDGSSGDVLDPNQRLDAIHSQIISTGIWQRSISNPGLPRREMKSNRPTGASSTDSKAPKPTLVKSSALPADHLQNRKNDRPESRELVRVSDEGSPPTRNSRQPPGHVTARQPEPEDTQHRSNAVRDRDDCTRFFGTRRWQGAEVNRMKKSKTGARSASAGCWRLCGVKRLFPERVEIKLEASRFQSGILRRCPLIDALHPALSRQRASSEFRTSLQSPEDGDNHLRNTEAEKATNSKPGPTNTVVTKKTACAKIPEDYRKEPTPHGKPCISIITSAYGVSTEPLPEPPGPRAKPTIPAIIPQSGISGSSVVDKKESGSGIAYGQSKANAAIEDVASRAGRLTILQWGGVESWMARARRTLGVEAWETIGCGSAFRRVRDHVRVSILSGGCVENVDHHRPLQEDQVVGFVDAKRGNSAFTGQDDVGGAREDHREMWEGLPGGWDDHLSQKTALALEATLWMLAPERERPTLGKETQRHVDRRSSLSVESSTPETARRLCEKWGRNERSTMMSTGDDALEADITVSLIRARRFVKACRLVDRVKLLEADVDLAFQRSQECYRARPIRPMATAAYAPHSIPLDSVRGSLGWAESAHSAGVGWAREAAKDCLIPEPSGHHRRSRLVTCEAVGCSEGARYGRLGLGANARYCRRHRSDGMVDIAGPRCERPDCNRIAMGADLRPAGGTAGGVFCGLHMREDRVGLEELSSVLLALAKARQERIRQRRSTPLTTSPTRSSSVSPVSVAVTPTSTCNEQRMDEAVRNASAVRNVLLALTSQPLLLEASVAPESHQKDCYGSFASCTGDVRGSVRKMAANFGPTLDRRTPHVSIKPPQPPERSDSSSKLAESSEEKKASVDRGTASHASSTSDGDTTAEPFGPSLKHDGTTGVTSVKGMTKKQAAAFDAPRPMGNSQRHSSLFVGDIMPRGDQQPAPAPASPDFSRVDAMGSGTNLGDRPPAVEECESVSPNTTHAQTDENAVSGLVLDRGNADHRTPVANSLFTFDGARRERFPPCDANIGGRNIDSSDSKPPGSQRAASSSYSRKGIGSVLVQNARALEIIFQIYSRTTSSSRRMALPDLLRFCGSFELRPGLVKTREILDAFKEVTFPGVLGLTDEDIGYSQLVNAQTRRSTSAPPPDRAEQWPSHYENAPENVLVASAAAESDAPSNNGMDMNNGRPSKKRSLTHPRGLTVSKGGGRTTYLGRSQNFPLRRVESKLAVRDRGFGLSGVASTPSGDRFWAANSTHSSRRRRSSSVGVPSRRASLSLDGSGEAQEPPVAPGLSFPQFLEWMIETITRSSSLDKAFKRNTTGVGRQNSDTWLWGQSRGNRRHWGEEQPSAQTVRWLADINAARAVAFLQWMELSHGMRRNRIPPFHLLSPEVQSFAMN